ncbi:MAG: DUF6484 domain-containing protein [Gammaproteobacteria bacterium]|nr:DUF6484 domain-containing protein [Gammaproteobacteria bacterium]
MNQNNPDASQASDEAPSSYSPVASGEVVIGVLVKFDEQGQPLVNFSENTSGHTLPAITTLGLTRQHIGRQVALLFANEDVHTPIIMGLIHSPLQDMLESFNSPQIENRNNIEVEGELKVEDVQIDGNKLVFEAKEEIVFKCGDSSITLTKSGKILIRGKYLLTRSTGVNRILGASVQVN